MRMTMDSAANSVVVDVVGGMVLKGTGAGDYYATVNTRGGERVPGRSRDGQARLHRPVAGQRRDAHRLAAGRP